MLFFVVVCASNPADHLPEHLLTLDRIEFDPALYYLELRDGGEDEIEVEKVKAAHFVNPGENVVVHSAFLPKDVAVAQNLVKTGADFFLCLALFVEEDNILILGSSETGVDIGDPGIAHCKVQIEEVADETVAGASGLKIEIPAETVLVVAFEEQVQKRAV